MLTQVNEAIASGIKLYDGRVLSSLDMDKLNKIFSGNIEMPMMSERLEVLNEVGEKLSSKYEGDWLNFINEGPRKLYSNGEGLIERLITDYSQM